MKGHIRAVLVAVLAAGMVACASASALATTVTPAGPFTATLLGGTETVLTSLAGQTRCRASTLSGSVTPAGDVSFSAISFTSCSSNGVPTTVTVNNIGTWRGTFTYVSSVPPEATITISNVDVVNDVGGGACVLPVSGSVTGDFYNPLSVADFPTVGGLVISGSGGSACPSGVADGPATFEATYVVSPSLTVGP